MARTSPGSWARAGGPPAILLRQPRKRNLLINGRLVRPIDVSLRMSKTYWIVCPKATSNVPKIATFRDWLLAEAADDARRLKALAS